NLYYMIKEERYNSSWNQTNSSDYVVTLSEYYVHEARYLKVSVGLNRWGYASQGVFARIQVNGVNSPTHSTATNGTSYGYLVFDLGEPLDRPTTGEYRVLFRKSNASVAGAVRMHVANRFLTDDA